MKKIVVMDKEVLDELYEDSAFTIEGLNTSDKSLQSLLDWIKDITEFVGEERIYIIKGCVMNLAYGLTGDNAYQKDINIVCVKLSDLRNPLALTMPRFQLGARWFDDIVINNKRREDEKKGVAE